MAIDSILYKMGVELSLEAPGLATAAALAIAAFEKIEKAAHGAGAGATAAQQQLDRAARAMRTLLIGGAVTAGGVFGVDIIRGWVEASSEMATVLARLSVTTHASREEMDSLESSFTRLTRTSQLSTTQIAGVAQAAAGAGLTNAKQLLATLPALVTYADVLQRTRGVTPEVSVPAAVKMENLFGIQPGSPRFAGVLNAIGEASKIAGSPQALLGQLRQAGPNLVSMGVPPEQMIPFLAVQAQLGLGASGGARGGLAAILRGLVAPLRVEGAKPPAQQLALAEIQKLGGGQLFDKAGAFAGLDRMLEIFARAAQQVNNPLIAQRLFATALGKQGGPLGLLLSNPDVVQRTQAMQQQIGTGSLVQDQATLMQTPAAQWTVLRDTLQSISEILGDLLIPSVLRVVTALARAAGAVASFLQSHKDVARFVALFAEFATAAMLVVGPVILAAGAFNILAVAGGTLGLTLMGTMPWLAAVGVAIGAVVIVATHWRQITKDMGPVLKALGTELAPLGTALGALWSAFGRLWAAMQPILGAFGDKVFGQFTTTMRGTPGALGPVIDQVTTLVNWMTQLVNWVTLGVTWLGRIIDPAKNAANALSPLQIQIKAVADALGAMVGWLVKLAAMSIDRIPVLGEALKLLGISGDTSPAAKALAALRAAQGQGTSQHKAVSPPVYHAPHPPIGKGGGGPFGMVPLSRPISAGRPPLTTPGAVHVAAVHITVNGAPHEAPEVMARRVQRSVEEGFARALNHYARYEGSGGGVLDPGNWGY